MSNILITYQLNNLNQQVILLTQQYNSICKQISSINDQMASINDQIIALDDRIAQLETNETYELDPISGFNLINETLAASNNNDGCCKSKPLPQAPVKPVKTECLCTKMMANGKVGCQCVKM